MHHVQSRALTHVRSSLAVGPRFPLPARLLAPCRSYLQATAALVQYPTASVSHELGRLLCWAPVKRFSSALMRVAVVAWHWVLAAGTREVQVI